MANIICAAIVQTERTGGVDSTIKVVRDLGFDVIDTVRKTGALHRDRRPDAYGDLVVP